MSSDRPQPKSCSWAQPGFYLSSSGDAALVSPGMLTAMRLSSRQAQSSAKEHPPVPIPAPVPVPPQPRDLRASPRPREPSGSREAAPAEARTDSAILCRLPEGMPGPAGLQGVPSPGDGGRPGPAGPWVPHGWRPPWVPQGGSSALRGGKGRWGSGTGDMVLREVMGR